MIGVQRLVSMNLWSAQHSPLKHSEPERPVANGASDRWHEKTMDDAEDGTNNRQGQTIFHDEGKSTQLMVQQAESVRYLNELNAVSNNYPIIELFDLLNRDIKSGSKRSPMAAQHNSE